MSNHEIVSALSSTQSGISRARLRRNVANALWSLRKSGLVEARNGKSALTMCPEASTNVTESGAGSTV